MDTETAKRLIDACAVARRVSALLPALPTELTRSHMHALDCATRGPVRVSQIARDLRTSVPNATALVRDLERRGDVRKVPDDHDRRAVLVELTDQGRETARVWIDEVHARAAAALGDAGVTDEDAERCIRTILRAHDALASADLPSWQRRRLADGAGPNGGGDGPAGRMRPDSDAGQSM